MTMTEAIQSFIARYTDFQGRSRRSEYWWVFLAGFIIGAVWGLLMTLIGGGYGAGMNAIGLLLSGIMFLFGLAVLIPGIALSVRRFHDLGQTGWLLLVFVLLGLIPIVGFLATIGLYIWFAMPGKVGPNQYGPDPKGGHDVGVFS
ncbi:MAG: DUF805 domain-containing protein [Pseudomonadota bacterium]